MSLIYKQPGSSLTAKDVNAIISAANTTSRLRSGDGIAISTVGGGLAIAAQPQPSDLRDCVKAKHTSQSSAPIYGVGEIYDALDTGTGETIAQTRRPTYSGFSRIGIYQAGASANDMTWLRTTGVGVVLYAKASLPSGVTLAGGMRLGCAGGTYYAQYDALGPMLVQDVGDDIDSNYGYAAVRMTGQRGDSIFVRDYHGNVFGPFSAVNLGAGLNATEEQPGVIRIDKVDE